MSFSTIRNRPPNSTKRFILQQIINNNVEKDSNIVTVYGPYPYGSSQDRQETLNQNRPLYFLLNLTDVIGIDKTLRVDTLRFYMTDILSNTNITIQFGVFRLTDGLLLVTILHTKIIPRE